MKGKTNLSIQLLSLTIAVSLWVIIMNVINPLVTGFVSLPLEIKNENYVTEQNKAYTVLDSRIVRVNYKVKSDYQTNIRQSDFRVFIDLSDLAHTNDLPVNFEILNDVDANVSNVQVEPKTIHVVIDEALRSEYPVRYSIKGKLDPEHTVGNVILSPPIIYASGANNVIDNIDHISIEIPLKNNEETFSGTSVPKVYAKDGTMMSLNGITLSAEEINYSVVVHSRVNVMLNAVVEGNVGNGYTYAGVQVNPNTIMINGPRSVIQNIYTIDLPTINIDGLTENKEFVYDVSQVLPIGITSNTQTVTVNVTINDNIINRPAFNQEDVGPHIDDTEESADESEESAENTGAG